MMVSKLLLIAILAALSLSHVAAQNGRGRGRGRGGGRGRFRQFLTTTAPPSPVQNLAARIKAQITAELRTDSDLVRKFVQMSFHDCFGGGCDGCINLEAPANRGLRPVVERADAMRAQMGTSDVTRGDFFALCGIAAAEFAGRIRQNNGNFISGILIDSNNRPFRFGRQSCGNPLSPPKRFHPEGFHTNGTGVLQSEFQLSQSEAVALLGAHSIGAMHSTLSGFRDGTWDLTPDILDHGYFIELRDATWKTERVNNNLLSSTQWSGVPPNENIESIKAMHIDLALMRSFSVSQTDGFHTPSCASNCPRATTANTVEQFAGNVQLFRTQFSSAFFKMVHTFP